MLVLKFRGADSNIRMLGVDATITRSTTKSVDLTDHPVENAQSIVDNVRQLPREMTLEIQQADFPLPDVGSASLYDGLYNNTFTDNVLNNEVISESPKPIDISNADGAPGRHIQFVKELEYLMESGTLIEVLTKFGPYRNMAIKSITLPEDSSRLDAARISVSLKEIRFVTLQTTSYEKPKIQQAKKKKDLGKVSTREATPKEEESGQTAARAIKQYLKAGLGL